jgi:hypothetical protein
MELQLNLALEGIHVTRHAPLLHHWYAVINSGNKNLARKIDAGG